MISASPEDLSRRAAAAVQRARGLVDLGPNPGRGRLTSEADRVGSAVAQLVAAKGDGWREARAAWDEARNAWWQLAATGRRVAESEARRSRGVLPYEDLLQEGWVGLFEAARRFDPDRGTKFVTVARWWVRAAIVRAVDQKGWMVTISPARARAASTARRFLAAATAQGQQLSREELAERCGLAPSMVELALAATSRPDSLDGPLDDGPSLSDALVADGQDPEALAADASRRRALDVVVASLDARTGDVMRDRMAGASLADVAARLGVSRERVRQIEKKAVETVSEALAVVHA